MMLANFWPSANDEVNCEPGLAYRRCGCGSRRGEPWKRHDPTRIEQCDNIRFHAGLPELSALRERRIVVTKRYLTSERCIRSWPARVLNRDHLDIGDDAFWAQKSSIPEFGDAAISDPAIARRLKINGKTLGDGCGFRARLPTSKCRRA